MWWSIFRWVVFLSLGVSIGGFGGLVVGACAAYAWDFVAAHNRRTRIGRHGKLIDEANQLLREINHETVPPEAQAPLNEQLYRWIGPPESFSEEPSLDDAEIFSLAVQEAFRLPTEPDGDPSSIASLEREVSAVRNLSSGTYSQAAREKLRTLFIAQLHEDLVATSNGEAFLDETYERALRMHRASETWGLTPPGVSALEMARLVAETELHMKDKWDRTLTSARTVAETLEKGGCDASLLTKAAASAWHIASTLSLADELEIALPKPWTPTIVQKLRDDLTRALNPLWSRVTEQLETALSCSAPLDDLEELSKSAQALHHFFSAKGIPAPDELAPRDQKRVWIAALDRLNSARNDASRPEAQSSSQGRYEQPE